MHFFSSKTCISLKSILLLHHESAENAILLLMKDTGKCGANETPAAMQL